MRPRESQSMKVIMLTTVHDPFDTRIFHRESVALARAGHDVTVVVPHHSCVTRDGVSVAAVRPPRSRGERMTHLAWRVWRKALSLKGDVYHFHDPELIPGALIARASGRRVIYDLHEDFPRTFAAKIYLPPALRTPLGQIAEWLEDAACRRFTALIAATPAIGERARLTNQHVTVVQNFPRLAEFPAPAAGIWENREPAVAYVGNLTRNRGLAEMLGAMALMGGDPPPALYLAGRFDSDAERQEAQGLPGWDRARDLGYLDRAGVAALLSRVRAGLVLLHPEPRYQVAWPVKLFEYMAAGVPVVVSDFPLWRDIVEQTRCGLVVDPLDPTAIAAAIRRVLDNAPESEAMGRRGRDAILDRFNWRTEELKLLDLYSRLDESRSRSRSSRTLAHAGARSGR